MAAAAVLTRTQEERTEAAKERIRDAALTLFGDNGYEATTLAAISLKAGFSRTLAQYHYPDKADLALELLDERIRRDNHLDLLACSMETSPEVAWARLIRPIWRARSVAGCSRGRFATKIIIIRNSVDSEKGSQ